MDATPADYLKAALSIVGTLADDDSNADEVRHRLLDLADMSRAAPEDVPADVAKRLAGYQRQYIGRQVGRLHEQRHAHDDGEALLEAGEMPANYTGFWKDKAGRNNYYQNGKRSKAPTKGDDAKGKKPAAKPDEDKPAPARKQAAPKKPIATAAEQEHAEAQKAEQDARKTLDKTGKDVLKAESLVDKAEQQFNALKDAARDAAQKAATAKTPKQKEAAKKATEKALAKAQEVLDKVKQAREAVKAAKEKHKRAMAEHAGKADAARVAGERAEMVRSLKVKPLEPEQLQAAIERVMDNADKVGDKIIAAVEQQIPQLSAPAMRALAEKAGVEGAGKMKPDQLVRAITDAIKAKKKAGPGAAQQSKAEPKEQPTEKKESPHPWLDPDRKPLSLGGSMADYEAARRFEKHLFRDGPTMTAQQAAAIFGGEEGVKNALQAGKITRDGDTLKASEEYQQEAMAAVEAGKPLEVRAPRTLSEIRDLASKLSGMSDSRQKAAMEYLGLPEDTHHSKLEAAMTQALFEALNPGSMREKVTQNKAIQKTVEQVQSLKTAADAYAEADRIVETAEQQYDRDLEAFNKSKGKDRSQKRKAMEASKKAFSEALRAATEAQHRADSIASEVRSRVKEILAVEDHTPVGYADGAAPFQQAKEATDFLTGLVARGAAGEVLPMLNAHREDQREHYSNSEMSVGCNENTTAATHIHEIGHAIEYRMPGAQSAVLQFLRERVGDEKPVKLKDRFGGSYDDSEMGRKDNFAKAFGNELSAYYAGKDYGGRSSEVLSMGVEQLYKDPVSFAKADPEYFGLVVGILNGSLRHKPIPE